MLEHLRMRLASVHPGWAACFVCALLIAFLLGRISHVLSDTARHPPSIVTQSGGSVATVVLDGFRDSALRGRTAGDVRLFVQESAVEIDSDGSFAITHPAFGVEIVSVQVPEGMHFVASKRGKKYYDVTSAGGNQITPENRVYFRTAGEAEAAGYTR